MAVTFVVKPSRYTSALFAELPYPHSLGFVNPKLRIGEATGRTLSDQRRAEIQPSQEFHTQVLIFSMPKWLHPLERRSDV